MQQVTKPNKDITLQGVNSFQQATIAPFMIQCLTKSGFTRPTPIQYHSINSFAKYPRHSIVAQSKSGTGKTLSFLVPILNSLSEKRNILNHTICVIILPTRELSIQVHQYLKQLITSANQIKPLPAQKQFKSSLKSITSLLTIGGIPIEDDKKTLLTSGANFVIGTVGRIYQLMESGYLKPDHLRYAIFDQGDKLFATKDEKLQKILKKIHNSLKSREPNEHNQNFKFMVYSATYDEKSIQKITQTLTKILMNQSIKQPNILYIQTLMNSFTNQFMEKLTQNWRQLNFVTFHKDHNKEKPQIDQKDPYKPSNNPSVKQVNQNTQLINLENIKKFCIQLESNNKSLIVRKCDKLKQVLSQLKFKKCMIFVQKKALLEQIHDEIKQFQPLLIHGSLSQALRIKAMNQANKSRIVISSDLLARGIDLILDMVVLFDANINETFWHRIGRTGRFGRVGVVVSLDKIQNWQSYDSEKINEILGESVVEESGLRKNQWYGTYMTEYGRWEDVNVEKQEILSKGYNFYDQEKAQLSKKSKKQIKQIEKKIEKTLDEGNKEDTIIAIQDSEHASLHQNHQKLEIKRQFISKKQFIDHYRSIIQCKSCSQLILKMGSLTGKQFQIVKYFEAK